MKSYSKINAWMNGALLFFALFLWIFWANHLFIGIRNCADEAWYLFGGDKHQELGIHTSESFNIIRHIFSIIPYNIVNSRIVAYICCFLGVFMLSSSSYYWLKKRKRRELPIISFFSIFFIFGALVFVGPAYSLSLHYNQLQLFFLLGMLSFYLWFNSGNQWMKSIMVFLIGFFSFYSVINIPPSGLITSSCLFLLVLYDSKSSIRSLLLHSGFLISGVVIQAFVYHFFVKDIRDLVYDFFSAFHVMDSSYGPLHFVQLIVTYLKELSYVVSFSSVLILLFFNLISKKPKFAKVLICLLCFLLFTFSFFERRSALGIIFLIPVLFLAIFSAVDKNQKSYFYWDNIYNLYVLALLIPVLFIDPSNFKSYIFPLIVITGVLILLYIQKKEIIKTILSKDVLFFILIIFFPLLASIGTNMILVVKMMYFIPVWGFLFCYWFFTDDCGKIKNIVLGLFILITLNFNFFTYVQKQYFDGSILNSRETTNLEALKYIKITETQKKYYEQVDSLLLKHGFTPGDKILAFNFELMTVYAVSGSLFSNVSEALAVEKFVRLATVSDENKPDYMILLSHDMDILSVFFEKHNWKLDDYHIYEIGEKFVFCKKECNIFDKQ